MEKKMEFSLGTNFDPELIAVIKKYDTGNCIVSVFGNRGNDIIGGGRPNVMLPSLSLKKTEEYINLCHKNKIKFNYLLNSVCMSNDEYTKRGLSKIMKIVSKLVDIGVDAVTINSVYLCELLKKRFPKLGITIGLFSRIRNLENVRRWIENGADELTLHPSLNRNFRCLEQILEFTKDSGASVRLIANNVCVKTCHMEVNHGAFISHSSGSRQNKKALFDYLLYRCTMAKVRRPTNLIVTEWIRPEDISVYEKLSEKTGNHNFSIKLVDRTRQTPWLERVIKAYTSRRYDGNLLDIMNWPNKDSVKHLNVTKIAGNAVYGGYNIKNLLAFFNMFILPKIVIDNNKLDGFIKNFISAFPCDSNICDLGENIKNKRLCSYCKEWADKVISYPEKEVENWLEKGNTILHQLDSGDIFLRGIK